MTFKSGFVTLIGRPNVGKSTLLNLLAGEKISIISDKPQTTRNSIKTVVTTKDTQMVFIDTPGIHKPKNKLGKFMVNAARETFSEVDVVLFLVEATSITPGAGDLFIVEQLKNLKTSVFLIINKIDLVSREQLLPIISKYKELMDFDAIIPVSAAKNDGVELLVEQLKKHLPEGPKYFPDDMLTDQPMKLIAAEFIREKILRLTKDEVPHGVGIEILQFVERTDSEIVDIQAVIYCERDSHKGILIGKEGKMLKKIGSLAREEMERILGTKIFLELWVKVKPDWRNNNSILKTLGYE